MRTHKAGAGRAAEADRGGQASARSESPEIVSLAERMGYLQVLRAGFVVVVLASAIFASRFVGASLRDLVVVSAGYFVLTGVTEALRRLGKARGLYVVAGMLLVDGVYLAGTMYATGFAQSPLRFLLYLHLIAVTLLASYRTGLKIALWHSLLFFVVFHGQLAGILAPQGVDVTGDIGALTYRPSVFNVMAFWLVALGTAVFSSVNEKELRRRKIDLEALNEMGVEFENVSDPVTVAATFLDRVCDAFDFKRGVVLASPAGDVSVVAARGAGGDDDPSLGLDDVVAKTWRKRETSLVRKFDAEANPRLARLLPGARNVLIVPLFADAAPLGVLAVEHGGRSSKIERRVLTTVGQFSSHAALAMRNAWLLEEIRRMADTDGLTGIANRRFFESALEKEISRAKRSGEQLTLVMLDIDHFKLLNDTHGHQVGDQILQEVGSALDKTCRDFDVPARYGGEEFAVLLPGCTTQESFSAAGRLRKMISEMEGAVPVTASAGVATFPLHATDAAGLVKAADEALYESKRMGRDRVTRSRRKGVAVVEQKVAEPVV
ncbi:MAG TPA: sensor domain-containing diguanylate cyclase [Actinomycetota bacterium]|nr:sensor domain-containing diguanylate cyclase [Actinomycetota bacterium]